RGQHRRADPGRSGSAGSLVRPRRTAAWSLCGLLVDRRRLALVARSAARTVWPEGEEPSARMRALGSSPSPPRERKWGTSPRAGYAALTSHPEVGKVIR